MSFSDIKDQDVPLRHLRQVLLRKRFPNGLLFWGPEGVGKRTTAMTFAQALLCTDAQGDACGQCLACRKVLHGNHPDLKIIRPSGKTRIIKVEAVEDMIEISSYRPFEGAWRVFVIEDADRMGIPAQNHFLKTLEEPPSATIFLLMSENPRMLLPTIRSRCHQVRFGALRAETVKDILLAQRHLPDAVAGAVAAVSQGQMSRAFDFVDSGKRDVVVDLAKRLAAGEDPLLLSGEMAAQLKANEEAILTKMREEDKEDLRELTPDEREERKEELEATVIGLVRRQVMEYLYLFAVWYRDAMVLEAGGPDDAVLNRDQLDDLRRVRGGEMGNRLLEIERARVYVERNLNRDRVFRDLFFKLGPSTTPAR